MDDARLEPQTGAALHAAALTKDLEAPLKRDMAICICINTSHIHNGQLNVPLPNAKEGESENPQLACPVSAFLGEMEFVLSPPQKCTSAPATLTLYCISTALSRLAPNFFFFPLYTTKAELMIAFTTGTALVLTRAMLRCSGHTSPLIWEQCENIWSVLMLPVLVEYLLRNWVAFIAFKTTPNFTGWASMTFSFVKAYGCINWRHLSENCCVPCCPFALTLMWKWRMYPLWEIFLFYDALFLYLMAILYASFPKCPQYPLMNRWGFARGTVCLFVTGRRVCIFFGVLKVAQLTLGYQ